MAAIQRKLNLHCGEIGAKGQLDAGENFVLLYP